MKSKKVILLLEKIKQISELMQLTPISSNNGKEKK